MNKSVLNEIKASYKRLLENSIIERLKYNATIEEIRHLLLTGEGMAFVGLNNKIELLNNPHEVLMRDAEAMRKHDPNYRGLENLSETDIQVLKDEIDVIIELLNKYCLVTKLVAGSASHNGEMKNYSYVITYEYRLLTREEGYLNYGLTDNAIEYNNFRINNKKVKSFTVDIEHEIFLDVQELEIPKAPEEKNFNKICSFIIGKYGDKEKYFFIDELMKELKQLFKVTQKEFKEKILNMLIDENKINLVRMSFSGHKTVRLYKNGIYYSVDRFIIPQGVFKNTFKA